MRTTLTRAEAHDVIGDAGNDMAALRALAIAWIGHADVREGAMEPYDALAEMLHEYVDAAADDDAARARGPRDTDRTGLVDPSEG